MNRVIVTGGAGFIGSNLIEEINRQGHENIVVTDFLEKGNKFKNLVPLRFFDYHEADTFLEKITHSPSYFGPIETVYHLGACASTTETDNRYLVENNFAYTKRLCEWALSQGAKFVYASSAATYGDGTQGMSDDEGELDKLRPLNMYAYSKHLFDCHARRGGFLHLIRGIKYFNIFGPHERHKGDMRSVVPKAFEQIRETGTVKLFKSYRPEYKDGEQKRDFLYVRDAVRLTVFLGLEKPLKNIQEQRIKKVEGGLFNVGMGKAHTWLELVHPIFEALRQPQNITFIDMPEFLRPRYQYFTQADLSKLQRQNGYQFNFTPFREAIEDYLRNDLLPSIEPN
jgi:ADP-L-glycero-D-manno-heptose 6-epimerase